MLFRKQSFGLITVEEHESQHTRIIKRDGKTTSGINLQTFEPTSNLLWFPHLAELFPSQPHRVLCLGGGACAFPIYAMRKKPQLFVDVIEIDPVVIEAAQKYFPLPTSAHFRLIEGDALDWLRRKRRKNYDLLFVDVGIVCSTLAPAYNTDFLKPFCIREYRKALTQQGILMINIIMTLRVDDIRNITPALAPFNRAFRSHFAFITNLTRPRSQFRDVLYVFTNQHITLRLLQKSLSLIRPDLLSYPKLTYLKMLDASFAPS